MPDCSGIAERRIQTGIRGTDDDVCLDRVLDCQEGAGALSCHVDALALDDRVRTSGVDILEYAQAALLSAVAFHRAQPFLSTTTNLAGRMSRTKLSADAVKRNAFGGKDNLVAKLAHCQRADALRVADRHQLLWRHDDHGIRALELVHRLFYRFLNRGGVQALVNDDVGDDLRVRAGVENSPFQLQFLLERLRIDQSAVEGKGHGALDVADNQRLHVRALRGAGGIQYMANRHAAAAQIGQYLLIKGVRHQADVAVGTDHAVVVDRDAAALLASVLQGVERHVGVSDNAWGIFRRENSKTPHAS